MKRLVLLFTLFTSTTIAAQQTLSIDDCRALAIQNNKELKISELQIRKADADQKAAFTKYFPQVSASGTYLRTQLDLQLIDPSLLAPLAGVLPIPPGFVDNFNLDLQNIWLGRVSLTQPVFMGGKIISYNQITKYAKELAEAQNDISLQEVIYKTDETYWQVISLVNKKKLADAYVDLLKSTERDINLMIAEGVATAVDGLSIKVKLNEAEMAQTKVNNGLALTRMALAQICGLPLDEIIILSDELLDELSIETESVIVDINEALINRPELVALGHLNNIYKKREAIVLSETLPNVGLMANYLLINPNPSNSFNKEFGGSFSAGVLVSIPLSGWWEGTHKRNAAKAETLIQKLNMDNARDKIELQVNQSIYKKNEANKNLAASVHNMEKADENLKHAEFGFKEGVIPTLNLMEAQTAWVSARSELINSQIEVKLTNVYLNKALGKLTVD
jgi:Outer membrane protein